MTKFKGQILSAVLACCVALSGCSSGQPTTETENTLFHQGLLAVEGQNGKWGYIDTSGKYVINPQFEDNINAYTYSGFNSNYDKMMLAEGFSTPEELKDYLLSTGNFSENGLAPRCELCDSGTKCGYIDKSGQYVINPQFDWAMDFAKNGLARVVSDGKYGYIDESGKYLINPQFDYACDFNENGLALVYLNGKFGFIDTNGKYVIAPQFDSVDDFSENGLAVVSLDGKDGYIDTSGNIVIEPQFYYACGFSKNGLAAVKLNELNDKWGYINTRGGFVIEPQFDNAGDFSENGLAAVELNGKYGYIDTSGNIVIEPQFDWVYDFSENGLAAVELNGKYGYIDTSGNVVIEPQFDGVDIFSENGLARVVLERKFGFIDKSGTYVIEPQFDYEWPFDENGLAKVELNGKYGFIDASGNIVIEPQFLDIGNFSANGLARVNTNGKIGYIDRTGNFAIEPLFKEGSDFYDDGYAVVRVGRYYGIIDSKGNYIANPQFSGCLTQTAYYRYNDWDIFMAITSANSTAGSLKSNIDYFLTEADTNGYGMKANAVVTINIDICNGVWTSVPTAHTPSPFYTNDSIITWNGGHDFTPLSPKSSASGDGIDLLTIYLTQLFPEIQNAAISAQIFDGRCIALAFSPDTYTAIDIPVAKVYGEDDGFDKVINSTSPWNGTTEGISDSNRMPGVSDDLIIGTAPVLSLS